MSGYGRIPTWRMAARPEPMTLRPDRPRVALVMVAIGDLSGSGGAERLFSDFHEYQQRHLPSSVTLITDASSLKRLRAAGRLSSSAGVVTLALGDRPGRGRLRVAWMTVRLLLAILRRRFDVVHVCLPSPIYLPLVAVLTRLPDAIRPRVALTVIDCTLALSLDTPPPIGTYEHQVLDAHRLYARWGRPDAIYSWYQAFLDAASRHHSAGAALLRAARYCFTETTRFVPAPSKEHLIVFAGRLSEQKRPLMFVDAVAALQRDHPELVAGWRFAIYGKGVLASQVVQRIAAHGLGAVVTLDHAADMAPIFARSRALVSTQAFENFTSLSMLEAMAAGNAVIAEDVGQTREFVHHGQNGFLVSPASASGFAAALAEFLRRPAEHEGMGRASRAIATEVHTVEHFAGDIAAFWADVARA
jgi:glycosyltransferase involved in cell wall biosynthesis